MREFLGIFGFLEISTIIYLLIRLFHHKFLGNSETNKFDFIFFTIISFLLSIIVKVSTVIIDLL